MTLEEAMKQVRKQFKNPKVINEGVVYEQLPRIPFSSPDLNYMTYGGLPMGRLVEFFGEESGGKTTTALDIVKNAQILFPDKKILYVDIEQTYDVSWADTLGVKTEDVILFTPDANSSAEKIFSATETLVDTGEFSVCVIDSFGALLSQQETDKDIETGQTRGGIAKALTRFSKEMVPICARTHCLALGINQLRDKFNSTYGGQETVGGRGWKHQCSVRMRFRRSTAVDENYSDVARNYTNPTGHYVEAYLEKSKVFPPNRRVHSYILNYITGIDVTHGLIEMCLKFGIIHKAGAWFSILDTETGEMLTDGDQDMKFQGRANLTTYLNEHPEWLAILTQKLEPFIK